MRRLPEVKFKDVGRYPLGVTYVGYKKNNQAVRFVRDSDCVKRMEDRQRVLHGVQKLNTELVWVKPS